MKFFNFLISSYSFVHSVYLDDVLDIPEPSHLLYSLYSIPHNQLPRNDGPNNVYPVMEILAEEVLMSFPLISLPNHLYLGMEDIQHAGEHDPYLPRPLVSEHSLHYRFGQPNPCILSAHRPLIHDSDTSLPILGGHSNDLQNVNHDDILPCCKSKKFIETKVAAINCRVLTIS